MDKEHRSINEDSSRLMRRWEYVDLELDVREGGQGEYTVHVLNSPEAGRPEEEMRFHSDDQELEDRLRELEKALDGSSKIRSSEVGRSTYSLEGQKVAQDLGRELFRALLPDEIRHCYRKSLEAAKEQDVGLRLKLLVRPSKLARLPWEFLYDPVLRQHLCLDSKRPLVRYPIVPQHVPRRHVESKLKILGMVANPRDDDLPPLDVEGERQRLEEALEAPLAKGLVELRWLEKGTWGDLEEAMEGGWHVFHFVGHGSFAKGESFIALENARGGKNLLASDNLATILKDDDDLRLVFLNSCEGARSSEGDAFSSTAAALTRMGIPAVLAMQYKITDKAAIEFSRAFYSAVANGRPVDAAVAEARRSLKMEMRNTLEWGTPVLYMRSEDGRMFDFLEQAPPAEPAQNIENRVKEDAVSRYRRKVKAVWEDEEVTAGEAERLRDIADVLGLAPGVAAEIEREVMGNTKEAILERQEQAASEEPREVGPKAPEAASEQSADDVVQQLNGLFGL